MSTPCSVSAGYWLGDGSISYSAQSVVLRTRKDATYLKQLLAKAGLSRAKGEWRHGQRHENGVIQFYIVKASWFSYFDAEYWIHYKGGRALRDDSNGTAPPSGISFSSEDENDSASTDSITAHASSVAAQLRLRDLQQRGLSRTEVLKVKSGKWLFEWVLRRLDRRQVRLVLAGLRVADGKSSEFHHQKANKRNRLANGEKMHETTEINAVEDVIVTSSVSFREAIMRMCLHAGYSAYFVASTHVGPRQIISGADKAALETSKQAHTKHTNWCVHYSDETGVRPVMMAADVRYNGEARKRQEEAGGATKIGRQLISTTAMLEKKEEQKSAAFDPIKDDAECVYDKKRDGRVWCVEVDHPDHLIFAQRAHRGPNGVVTKVSRPIIVGNCGQEEGEEE